MKAIFLITLAISFTPIVYGQELQYKRVAKDYSWEAATTHQIDSFYYDLNSVRYSKGQIYLRISFTGQVVDLFSVDGEHYRGVLTNKITEYESKKLKGQEYEQSVATQEIHQKIALNDTKVKFVIDSLIASNQLEFPTDSLIQNWNTNFVHCGYIHFQYKIDGQYKTQEYFCPWSQSDTIAYKGVLIDNYNLIKTTFFLDSLYERFESKLQKGKLYSRDGYRMMYKMTDKEIDSWEQNKPKREYLKSIKDTIDSYIETKLRMLEADPIDIDCFEEYQLIFSKSGRLKKVKVLKYDKPTLKRSLGLGYYVYCKKMIRQCKRRIKEVLSEIDLSFINLKHEVHRTFSFDHKGQYLFSDDTVY